VITRSSDRPLLDQRKEEVAVVVALVPVGAVDLLAQLNLYSPCFILYLNLKSDEFFMDSDVLFRTLRHLLAEHSNQPYTYEIGFSSGWVNAIIGVRVKISFEALDTVQRSQARSADVGF
jgi:hypothetical protein